LPIYYTYRKGGGIMKLLTLDEMVAITTDMFDQYVEPVALSLMSGEVPSSTFAIHRSGTRDKDWLARVRFKNTVTISVFRCDVYLDDVMMLCRMCKMFLVTPEVFRVAVTFSMLYPLYQTQHMNFSTDVNSDYDSMMAGAGKATYTFMSRHFAMSSIHEQDILDILYYRSMTFINCYKYAPKGIRVGDLIEDLTERYIYYMREHHKDAYRTARYYKARTNLVNEEGYVILEPITKGGMSYEQ